VFPTSSGHSKTVKELPKKAPKNAPGKTAPGPTAVPQQEATIEAMLISTGHLDGEVGRVAKSDFDKAVAAFQASLGRDGVGGELTASQRKTLQGRFEATRAAWQLRKVSDLQGFELSLPARLLSESRRLKYGRRYGAENGDFSVDVAQLAASDWTLEKLEEQHCCRISPTRKLEYKTVVHADGDVRGFILSALDGNDRISVRAFQRTTSFACWPSHTRSSGTRSFEACATQLRRATSRSHRPPVKIASPHAQARSRTGHRAMRSQIAMSGRG
jgi:hypothetical protein